MIKKYIIIILLVFGLFAHNTYAEVVGEVCDGENQLTLNKEGRFMLCWDKVSWYRTLEYEIFESDDIGSIRNERTDVIYECNDHICETGPMDPVGIGVYYYRIVTMDTLSDTAQGSPSNQAVLTVIDNPNNPGGFLIITE